MVEETDDDVGLATTNSVTPVADDGNGVSGSPDTENTSFGGGGRGGSRSQSFCHSQRSLSHVFFSLPL